MENQPENLTTFERLTRPVPMAVKLAAAAAGLLVVGGSVGFITSETPHVPDLSKLHRIAAAAPDQPGR